MLLYYAYHPNILPYLSNNLIHTDKKIPQKSPAAKKKINQQFTNPPLTLLTLHPYINNLYRHRQSLPIDKLLIGILNLRLTFEELVIDHDGASDYALVDYDAD